mgnify:CR=1 FL=1
MPDHILDSGDSPDLEALFDSIAASQQKDADTASGPVGTVANTAEQNPAVMYEQIGQLTRKMHDALRDLGYDKSLEKVVRRAEDVARLAPENPEFMPAVAKQNYRTSETFSKKTAAIDPEFRAQAAA